MNQLPSIFFRLQEALADLAVLQDEKKPPSSLMLNSVRVFIAPPQSIKENMLRSFSWIDADQVKLSNKSD